MLVDRFLGASADLHPERIGLVCDGRRLTYREIETAANRLARGLQAIGIRRGDRVVIQLENSIEAVISIFGILRAGAVFVPVGPTVKADKLAHIVHDSEAAAIVTDAPAWQAASPTVRLSAPAVTVIIVGESDPAGSDTVGFESLFTHGGQAGPGTIDLDLAALIYTSGSTGRPKGVALTHSNMVAAATSIGDYLENTADDVILNVLPLSFDYGLYQVFLAFRAGARLVLERSCVYTTQMLDLMVRERVTGLPIVPMLAVLLLKHDLRAYPLSLRYLTNTGAVLPPAHISALRQMCPGARIYSMYGLTECKRVSFLDPDEIDERPTSVGKPMDNVEVYVAAEDGSLHETGTGELVIRGANVMQGYWRAPEETARVLKPGPLPGQSLLYSGDLFHIDEQGYMYFQARIDDLMKIRGQRVSPREVENAIYELRAVRGVSVVAVADETQGTVIKAIVCVDPASPLTEQDVLRHCSQRLEDFMVPRTVEFAASLPCTESGKIQRRPAAAFAERSIS